jgi:hypothetical protein
MYYLKCNNCGHLNEVKSGALSFCVGCNKPLDNSFLKWTETNPGKTFEDFKKEVCINVPDAGEVKPKPKGNASKILRSPVTIVSVLVVIVVGLGIPVVSHLAGEHLGTELLKWFRSEKTSEDVLTKDWVKGTYGIYGLTVETPQKMIKDTLPMPDNVMQAMERLDSYGYMSAKGFKVVIVSAKGKPTTQAEFNLQAGANGAVNQVRNSPGVTDFTYKEEQTMADGIPGIIQRGTYKQNGIGVEFIDALYAHGRNYWQVMVLYEDNDEVGRTAANRVVKSIHIVNTASL